MLFPLYNSVASPTDDRPVEPAPTQKVVFHIRISLLFNCVFIKTFMYDGLEHKRKFFEISKRDVSDVHPTSWVPEISIEVCNSMYEQSNNAR